MKISNEFRALLILLTIGSCSGHHDRISIPEEINKRLIVSKDGDLVIYSSNREGYFRPYILQKDSKGIFRQTAPPIGIRKDLFTESLSHDKKIISLVSEDFSTRAYDIFLYDIEMGSLKNLTQSALEDDSHPEFSPTAYLLAYIANYRLKIYDYRRKCYLNISSPHGISFGNIVWSAAGNYIYLEDRSSDIWAYDLRGERFTLVWKCPHPSYVNNRLITPDRDHEGQFYFISDHESDFNQIYKGELSGRIMPFITSDSDKFLIQRPFDGNDFYYKMNIGGDFVVYHYIRGESKRVDDCKGVIYDYYSGKNGSSIRLYASPYEPASVFEEGNGNRKNLAGVIAGDSMPIPITFSNSSGMSNYVYEAKNSRGWVVWLHGGPYEQMSVRYNPYLLALIKAGWSVAALNYPGSTGVGNRYELRSLSGQQAIDRQVAVIRDDLMTIRMRYAIKDYSIVGVSYGSIPAHYYANQYKEEVRRLVDLSGIFSKGIPSSIPALYIYGKYDFALTLPGRADLLRMESNGGHARTLIFDEEDHIINRRPDIEKTISGIVDFLD